MRSICISWGAILVIVAVFSGCSSSSQYTAGQQGRTISYQPGQPTFDIEAAPSLADTGAVIDIYVSILRSSLTFYRGTNGYFANYDISVRLRDPDSEEMLLEHMWPETVQVATYPETQANTTIRLVRTLPAPAGKYLVEVRVDDRQSQKSGSRYQVVTLHAVQGNEPTLGPVLLYWSSEEKLSAPETAFHIPERSDSLIGIVEMYQLDTTSAVTVGGELLRYAIDTAMATPPFYYYSSGGLMMEGRRLYPKRADTVFRASRRIVTHTDRQTFAFPLPWLRRGMYQLSVHLQPETSADADNQNEQVAHRYFALMTPGFPKPVELPEMVKMVGYIATEQERADLDSCRNLVEMRQKFEQFWLRHTKDRQVAANLIKKYYSRAEEANRLFSTFKEGWRTDRGMIYIVLGPPEYVEKHFDTELWYYNLPGTSDQNILQFHRVFFSPDDLSLEDFTLNRSTIYQVFWDRIVNKWREGEIY